MIADILELLVLAIGYALIFLGLAVASLVPERP